MKDLDLSASMNDRMRINAGTSAGSTEIGAGVSKWAGLGRRVERVRRAFSNLGPSGWLLYQFQERRLRRMPPVHPVVLTSKYSRHSLLCRPRSSDLHVFYQIFVAREFACLDDITDPGLVVDCGAYVGYASAYFLSRFPGCDVISVEPDPENFRLLSRNLSAFGRRASPVQAAIWSHSTQLKISETKYRDGHEWTRQVRPCHPGEEGDVPAVDIGSLLRRSGYERISILKIDIEGAEAVVLTDGYQDWIDRVDVIAIELHDDTCFGDASGAFSRAMARTRHSISRAGELTVCRVVQNGEGALQLGSGAADC
jgi:FkbM family methyltransferase